MKEYLHEPFKVTKKQIEILDKLDDVLDDIETNFNLADEDIRKPIADLRIFILKKLTNMRDFPYLSQY